MKKFFNVKTISLLLAVVLLVCGAVGGTLAWIIDSKSVTNTFTYGDINITLDEAKTNEDGQPIDEQGNVVTDLTKADRTEGEDGNQYKMIPGSSYTKDPTVTVLKGSEACWLFIEITEVNDAGSFLTYSVDAAWTQLSGSTNVYYREVAESDADQPFNVLTGKQVTVSGDVTKEALKSIGTKYPQLTFTAYAVQKDNVTDAATAWGYAKPTNP